MFKTKAQGMPNRQNQKKRPQKEDSCLMGSIHLISNILARTRDHEN